MPAELQGMSQMAQARGGYWAQATLLVQAANLSESLDTRAHMISFLRPVASTARRNSMSSQALMVNLGIAA